MMKATVTALCMTLVMVVYSEIFPNGTKLVYKEDLPDAFTFDKKKLDELKQKLMSQTKGLKKDEMKIDLQLERLRKLNSAKQELNDRWCCRTSRPTEWKSYYTVQSYTAYVVVHVRGYTSCGLFGWERCAKTTTQMKRVTKYRAGVHSVRVPIQSSEWDNGCPEELIACCACYIYNPRLDDCITQDEQLAFLEMQATNCHEDLGYIEGFLPYPQNVSCPELSIHTLSDCEANRLQQGK